MITEWLILFVSLCGLSYYLYVGATTGQSVHRAAADRWKRYLEKNRPISDFAFSGHGHFGKPRDAALEDIINFLNRGPLGYFFQSANIRFNRNNILMAVAMPPVALIVMLTILGVPKAPSWLAASFYPFFLTIAAKNYKAKYVRQFKENLPAALGMLANTLEVGHSVDSAFETVAQNCPAPVSTEFKSMLRELNFGYSLLDALRRMYNRLKVPELRLLLTAISVQRQTGGNLSEILKNMENTIQSRFALEREIKTLSSEGRLSIKVIMGLPLIVMIPQFLSQREATMSFYSSAGGMIVLIAGLLLQFAGYLLYRKLVKAS